MIERSGIGSRFSKIVKHNGVVYLAGQVGDGESIEEQTASMLARVDALLEEAGTNKSNILQNIVWVSDMKYFDGMNKVYDAWIDPECPPARACGEAKLASERLKVEIIVTAAYE